MKALKFLFCVFLVLLFVTGCTKEHQQADEGILAGVWVKGSNAGDTLIFNKKNNLNILRYNASFNAGSAAFTEMQYNYTNEKLGVQNIMASGNAFYTISSFTWKERGQEFEVRAIELFPFVSSTTAVFSYTKVQ